MPLICRRDLGHEMQLDRTRTELETKPSALNVLRRGTSEVLMFSDTKRPYRGDTPVDARHRGQDNKTRDFHFRGMSSCIPERSMARSQRCTNAKEVGCLISIRSPSCVSVA